MNILDLNILKSGMYGLTPAWGTVLLEAASICLDTQEHTREADLTVSGTTPTLFKMTWQPPSEQAKRSHSDLQEATEYGACGVAIALAKAFSDKVVIERSYKGGGFDYWLGDSEEEPLFKNKTRLEVSGILQGNETTLKSRIKQKKEQISVSNDTAAGCVAVVEFSNPLAHLEDICQT